jgi:cardiolipin synthase
MAEVRVGPNLVALLKDGFQAFPAMLEAIAAAQHTVCLETYILRDDAIGMRFVSALTERARAGVEVLLMYDDWGSDVAEETFEELRRAGVRVLAFRPLRLSHRLGRVLGRLRRRNHRKSLVVDGQVGFTGGLNISDDYSAVVDGGRGWRDTHVRIVGPTAQDLERLFLETWARQKGPKYDAGRFVRTRGAACANIRIVGNDFALDKKAIRRAYTEAFTRAGSHIFLTHAYFLPPAKLLKAIIAAARRGVRVAVILAATTDVPIVLYAARGLYPRLLRAGVEVYEWNNGRVLHAKTAVADGLWATVGSSNLDQLSLRQNLEVNAIVLDGPFALALERLFAEDLGQCVRVTRDTVKSWTLFQRAVSWLAFQVRHWL